MPKEVKDTKAKKPRVKKDKDAPKRGLSSYMLFSQAQRETVKAENPDVTFGQIGKLLGQKWKELTDEEKEPYNQAAARDKERYEHEKADYESRGGGAGAAKAKKAPVKQQDDDEDEDESE